MRKWIFIILVLGLIVLAVLRPGHSGAVPLTFVGFQTDRTGQIFAVLQGRLPYGNQGVGINSIHRLGAAGWEPLSNKTFTTVLFTRDRIGLGTLPVSGQTFRIVYSLRKKRVIDYYTDLREKRAGNGFRNFTGGATKVTIDVPAAANE